MSFARGRVRALILTGCVAGMACERLDVDHCGSYCGPGTTCVDGRCVVAPAEAMAPAPVDADADGEPDRRKGRRGKRGKAPAAAGAVETAAPGFVPVDDRAIPEFRAVDQVVDMKGGSERLSDREVDRHLRRLERGFQACVETAAQISEVHVGGGTIGYHLRIEPSGEVSGVSAKAPPQLSVFGIVPCVRKAIHEHRFPAFDGPSMVVESSFRVD